MKLSSYALSAAFVLSSVKAFACPTVIAPSIEITINGRLAGLETALTDRSSGEKLDLDNVEGNLFSTALKAGEYLVTLSRDGEVLASQLIILKNAGCHSTFKHATFDCGIENGEAICRAYE